MINIVTRKEPCIKKLYAIKNVDHASPTKHVTKNQTKIEANNVAHKK